jgi:hypothetical protein
MTYVTIRDPDDWEAEEVGEFPPSRQRDQVLAHPARARVVSLSLPVSALDDALWEAVSAVLDYFTEHHSALVHIEGEGRSASWCRFPRRGARSARPIQVRGA